MQRLWCSLVLLLGWPVLAADQPVPNVTLTDINPRSVRFGAPVSPRDYLLQVSGYYFAAAG